MGIGAIADCPASLKTKATAYTRQQYARYVAGELTWADMHQALNAA